MLSTSATKQQRCCITGCISIADVHPVMPYIIGSWDQPATNDVSVYVVGATTYTERVYRWGQRCSATGSSQYTATS